MQDLPQSGVTVDVKVFNSGWVAAKRGVVLSGGGLEELQMPALFAMFKHPVQGAMLYDTGYHTRFYEATEKFPFSILRILTPAKISEDGNAIRQVEKAGLAAADIKTIIIGHGHVDHIPGALDFPAAKIIIDRRELAYMQSGSGVGMLFKGYIKSFNDKLTNDVETVDFANKGQSIGPFPNAIDLWNDGSMILVPLEGHTIGQMGLLVNASDGKRYFFISDAAWISENYLDLKPPFLIVRTILHSYHKFKATLYFLNNFHNRFPEVVIVPCHCPTVYAKLKAMGTAI